MKIIGQTIIVLILNLLFLGNITATIAENDSNWVKGRIEFTKKGLYKADMTDWKRQFISKDADQFTCCNGAVQITISHESEFPQSNEDFINTLKSKKMQDTLINAVLQNNQIKNAKTSLKEHSASFRDIGNLKFFTFSATVSGLNKTISYDFYTAIHQKRKLTIVVLYPDQTLEGDQKKKVDSFLNNISWIGK